MKLYKPKRIKEYSGRVEVAINPLDTSGIRMSSHDGIQRKSIRLEDTTPDEVYRVIVKALTSHCKAGV